jgi:excisionase family DNA binding protein
MRALQTIAEASQELRISKSLLYTLIRRRKIPAYRLAGLVRLDIDELREIMRREPETSGNQPEVREKPAKTLGNT